MSTEQLTIQMRSAPEETPPPRLFTTDEVEAKLLEAYTLGYNAAMDKIREPIRLLMELNHQLIGMQQTSLDILKGSSYDRYW